MTTKKILIADDDTAICDVLGIILEDAGYCVITSSDGEVVKSMKKDLPDLIILDIWLAQNDGRELCKELKMKKLTRQIPVILISASHEIAKSAKKAGANEFLPKPFNIDELLFAVHQYV